MPSVSFNTLLSELAYVLDALWSILLLMLGIPIGSYILYLVLDQLGNSYDDMLN